MGEHKGYRVVPVVGKRGTRYRGEYRHLGRYVSATYATKDEAEAWAMSEAAGVLRGDDHAVLRRRCDTAAMAKAYDERQEQRGRSASHRVNVRHTLQSLAKAVPNLADEQAHRRMEAWFAALRIERSGRHARKRAVAPSAGLRNRMLAEVRAFCRWLVRQEHLVVDPSRTLERVDVRRGIKAQFSVDDVRQICAPTADHPRQRWVALMLLAGLRADEALALTWADIQGSQIYIRSHAGHRLKRNKERLVPLQARLAEILGPAGTGLVAPLSGAHSTVQMGRHFKAFLRRCGMEPAGRTPHSCRHTYGALMVATGCPDILVKAYMGHESVATTADYAKAAPLHVAAVTGWGMGVLMP